MSIKGISIVFYYILKSQKSRNTQNNGFFHTHKFSFLFSLDIFIIFSTVFPNEFSFCISFFFPYYKWKICILEFHVLAVLFFLLDWQFLKLCFGKFRGFWGSDVWFGFVGKLWKTSTNFENSMKILCCRLLPVF